MKKNILCIVGESGTGKTTVADYIGDTYHMHVIQSHTDRPKRHPDETGHTFHTPVSFDMISKDDYIAYTKYGDYRYCATKSDLKQDNVYVIDEPGLDMLVDEHGHEFNITSLRIIRTYKDNMDEERLNRNLNTYSEKLDKFDYVIYNNTSISNLEKYVDEMMEDYRR